MHFVCVHACIYVGCCLGADPPACHWRAYEPVIGTSLQGARCGWRHPGPSWYVSRHSVLQSFIPVVFCRKWDISLLTKYTQFFSCLIRAKFQTFVRQMWNVALIMLLVTAGLKALNSKLFSPPFAAKDFAAIWPNSSAHSNQIVCREDKSAGRPLVFFFPPAYWSCMRHTTICVSETVTVGTALGMMHTNSSNYFFFDTFLESFAWG